MDGLRRQAHALFLEDKIGKFEPSALPFETVQFTQRGRKPLPSFPPRDNDVSHFIHTTRSFETVQITQHSQANVAFDRRNVSDSQLLELFNRPCEDNAAKPTLQLVTIVRSGHVTLDVDRQLFQDLFEACCIDPFFYDVFTHEKYGFQRARAYPTAAGPDYIDSYYVNTISALLVWSYDSGQKRTRAICIPNHPLIRPEIAGAGQEIIDALHAHKTIVGTPHLMLLVGAIVSASWLRKAVRTSLHKIREFESKTGQGAWRVAGAAPPTLDELGRTAEAVGYILTVLGNATRHQKILSDMLALEGEPASPFILCDRPGEPIEKQALTALYAVKSQIDMETTQIEFLQGRSQTQQSVIFNLIGQKQIEASLEIAKRAKEDSASMKMLGIVATVFLPGTFFATLFAIPSLRWSEPQVISDRFWIYWAFVLPSTAVLLLGYWYTVKRLNGVAGSALSAPGQ